MLSALRHTLTSGLTPTSLKQNVLAGLVVGIIALPLSMALAIASGVPPQHGLYTACIAGILIAMTGGSNVNISGPTAAFVVILLPIVQQYGLGGLLLSGLMAGIILVLAGLARFGKLIEIVPYPVTLGFTTGIGVVIATLQIKDFLGLNITLESHYLANVNAILQALPQINWQETVIGCLTLATLIGWKKVRSSIPAHLVALLVGACAAWLGGQLFEGFSVATIGSRFHYELQGVTGHGIPPVLPSFEWPWNLPDRSGQPIGISFALINTLLGAAITIAVLGAIESLLCAVVADGMTGGRHKPNDELIGQGLGNIVVAFFGGIPATAAIARTTANIKSGGSTAIAAITHGLFIVLAMLFLAPSLAHIPMASMAALLLMVAWGMSDVGHFARSIKIAPRSDVITLLTCFFLTVIFDMTIAVGVGMGLAATLFIHHSSRLAENRQVKLTHSNDSELPQQISVYDINGPLFFGSAQRALRNMIELDPRVRVIILDMSEVTLLDMSAIVAIESIVANLMAHRIGLVINNLPMRMVLKLRRAHVRMKPGRLYFCKSMPESISKAEKMCQLNPPGG